MRKTLTSGAVFRWGVRNNLDADVKRLTITMILLLGCAGVIFAQAPRDPNRAVLYSALVPGGGQIYNHAWLKAGLVIGVQGFLIGSAVYHDGKRDDFEELAQNTTDALLAQQYQARSREYKDALNNDIWWIGITAALSMIDAYVDAHLYDFAAQEEKVRLRFEDGNLLLQYRF